ncbi:hypothetical protein GE09DRAFT_624397 [Coniochaeta sp. 2T2.1]|nr:hypothetical protein GE09DRAFT_624397 [Coniochaeta sp. 2T2.1]
MFMNSLIKIFQLWLQLAFCAEAFSSRQWRRPQYCRVRDAPSYELWSRDTSSGNPKRGIDIPAPDRAQVRMKRPQHCHRGPRRVGLSEKTSFHSLFLTEPSISRGQVDISRVCPPDRSRGVRERGPEGDPEAGLRRSI